MKILERNQLLEYLRHAIELETSILAQKKIISEYENSSLERKPFLREKELPPYPHREISEKNPGDESSNNLLALFLMLIFGAFLAIFSAGSILYGISGGAEANGSTVDVGICLMMLFVGIGMMIPYLFIHFQENKEIAAISSRYYKEIERYKEEKAEIEEYNSNAKKEYQRNLDEWNASNTEAQGYLQAPLTETEQALKSFYELDVIYPKYHNLPALTSMYEYLITGRCEELAGPHGAYNLYEDEVRKDTVISQLNTVIENLEQIKQNQYMLYEQVVSIQQTTKAIAIELYQIKGYTFFLTELATLNTYYSGIAAANSTALAYSRSL